ncbi:MAG: adenylosuccinate lyase, partial [Deltaproteobacteria bacterium]|nr:adenylosuccinate lyase [Deltaproteobacteria bacterium]
GERGGGREALHEVIKRHSVAVARALREGSLNTNDLSARLGDDPAFPLSRAEVEAVLLDPRRFLGAAPQQADAFAARAEAVRKRFPEAAGYRPEPIL